MEFQGMQELATGYGLIEGPVWDAGKGLYFSDVLGGGIYLLDRGDKVSLATFDDRLRGFIQPSNSMAQVVRMTDHLDEIKPVENLAMQVRLYLLIIGSLEGLEIRHGGLNSKPT